MRHLILSLLIAFLFAGANVYAQDSSKVLLSSKFLSTVSSKADKYYSSITSKTEKTLERLSKWESKIKLLLEKASPATALQLFGNNQLTFSSLLQQYKNGKAAADNYKGRYDEYRDKLTTSLKYISDSASPPTLLTQGSATQLVATTREKIKVLNAQLKNTEAVQSFIKERKKQLLQQALQVAGNNKFVKKINKESYYYVQALGNYKETFSDPKKTEALAMKVLEKIPAFNDFIRKNSMLASLFRMPGDGNDVANLAGLQTRAQVNGMIQQQITAGGPNAMQQFRDNLQSAQSQLAQLKDKVLKAGGSSDMEMPEGFKPNDQKTKSFFKRLEYGTNVQTQKATAFFPVTSDLGLSVGYKLNDKSTIGIGASYKLGFGRGWNAIRMSQQGAGLRSFIDWKVKGSFWVSGGYEMNYKSAFNSIDQLQSLSAWQTSGLIGLSKSIPVKTKFFKKTKMQLLWDFMSYQQLPRTQPILFRVGYIF